MWHLAWDIKYRIALNPIYGVLVILLIYNFSVLFFKNGFNKGTNITTIRHNSDIFYIFFYETY